MKTYQCQSCGEIIQRQSVRPFIQYYCEKKQELCYLKLVPVNRNPKAKDTPPKKIKPVKKKKPLQRKKQKEPSKK